MMRCIEKKYMSLFIYYDLYVLMFTYFTYAHTWVFGSQLFFEAYVRIYLHTYMYICIFVHTYIYM